MNVRTMLLAAAIGVVLASGCADGPRRITGDVNVSDALAGDKQVQEFAADPVKFLEGSADTGGLKWYDAHVTDYTTTLYKLERMDPKATDFLPEQKLACKFKEKPYSVFCHTLVNARGAYKALYVEGQWDNKMKARIPLLGTFEFDPHGSQATQQTLRPIDRFGFKRSLEQIAGVLQTARQEKIATIKVIGTSQIGGRAVLIFEYWIKEPEPGKRFGYPHARVYLDRKWRLPLGVDLWDVQTIERARYRFEDIKLPAGLTDNDFTPKANGM